MWTGGSGSGFGSRTLLTVMQIPDVVSIKLLKREDIAILFVEDLFYCSIDSERMVSCSEEKETCFFSTCS
jgi:hypothetical protein